MHPRLRRLSFPCDPLLLSLSCVLACATLDAGVARAASLRAGAAVVDITPEALPVLQNGGFLEATADRVLDPLHARALVLDDGALRLAIVVVDSCMVPVDLCDEAKQLASPDCGISPEHILIAATHTHSAPSAMDYCLGCRGDPGYMRTLPPLLARAIVEAARRLEPAELGSTVTSAPGLTHCRRWILRPDRVRVDPFGERNVRANMHPGYRNPDFVGPAGPVDDELSLLSVRTRAGKPLALLANYSMHYFGVGGGLSADYFGRYAREMERRLGGDGEGSSVVAMMSQGTSGDLHWMDYSRPPRSVDIDDYARQLAEISEAALRAISHSSSISLAMRERRLEIPRRLPDERRLEWARRTWTDPTARPRNQPEVYAEQALYLAENPSDVVPLQALRVGDLAIAAIPCEVYGVTGLKIKARSPLEKTLNMELANGASGYIPPREQHALGGYTTWPARSAGLVVEAEERIVETVIGLLEEVTGASRREPHVASGSYVDAVRRAGPVAHWRLEELEGPLLDETPSRRELAATGGLAFHLPGPESSAFSGDARNRAVHLAGGWLEASVPLPDPAWSVELWLWNGLPADSRPVTGDVLRCGPLRLAISGTADETPGRLVLGSLRGTTPIALRGWHHVVVVREGARVRVHLDGDARPEIEGELSFERGVEEPVGMRFGGSGDPDATFEGRLDEISVYDRALTPVEVGERWAIARVPLAVRPRVVGHSSRPESAELRARYEGSVLASRPVAYWTLRGESASGARDGSGNARHATLEPGARERPPGDLAANFTGGRLRAVPPALVDAYSIELWFRNDTPNDARAVTGYLASRGPADARGAPGDHLGIGGTHSNSGRLFVYNGDHRGEIVAGSTVVAPGTWNHVVLVRSGGEVRIHLNGAEEPDARGRLEATFPPDSDLFVGARNEGFAPFRGVIEDVAVFDRALTPGEISARFRAAEMPPPVVTASRPEPARLESPPLSPQETLAGLHVREGYEVELVAAEPLVRDPVAIDFGPDGRLWVAEMADYPYGMDGAGRPGGRVRYLEDTDGDGRLDRSVVFVEPIGFPTGVMSWRDGVLITAAPDILLAVDRDGDGHASGDEVAVLYTGFLPGNQQLRVNGPTWGVDNWVHLASGGHHPGHGARNSVTLVARGESVPLGSRDLRVDPDRGLLEPLSGPSQFGRVRDDWGQWFGVQNSHPLWHYVLEDRSSTRNPHVPARDARQQLRVPANPRVYMNKPPQKRYHSHEETSRFTSACGISIYRDTVLFERSEVTHAFTCEPFHNVVQHSELRESGVTFTAERSSGDGRRDFLAAADRWCRPVMTRTGPDGALWVVDMYRYMIEHPDWLPPAAREELRPFYRAGVDRGRIYRIVRSAAPASRRATLPALATLSSSELVERLASANGPTRDLAQRLLVHRRDLGVRASLEAMALEHEEPRARLHALACLDGLEALSPGLLLRVLREEAHGGVVRWAIRLAEAQVVGDEGLLGACLAHVHSPHATVRLQLAKSLGVFDGASSGRTLAELARRHADDPWMRAAIAGSALHHASELALGLVDVEGSGASELLAAALSTSLARGDLPALVRALDAALALPGEAGARRGHSVVTSLLESLEARGQTLASLDPESGLRRRLGEVIASAAGVASDERLEESTRIAAIRLLAWSGGSKGLEALEACLAPTSSSAVERAAVEALSRHGSSEAWGLLLAGWKRYLPELRTRVAAALVASPEGARRLLEGIADGAIPLTTIAATERQALLRHRASDVAERARELLGASASSDRERVLAALRPALALSGDPTRGEAIFRERCARCHLAEGARALVGPDLAALSDRTPASLLDAIVVPGRLVEPRYLAYTAVLASGELVQGLVAGETGNSVLFRLADGSERAVLRETMRRLESTGLSFMPEGLEADLEPQDVADLLAHVASLGARD